ncbi:class I SAM-dependent methyltransferase [Metabacillus bambusae]|uniref:Class I SAM-dependent methyltransferase n=1 Tax=Metabacillus bambusae TaxID=2795218 RepID=A0ABS3MZQ2_9BACI|nr:class I SAM-dependent methyltransferase [Metabacillus bambusae]MBO1511497.1 class I SAM-dependent methyltransferase [Metabacillus bambusae]
MGNEKTNREIKERVKGQFGKNAEKYVTSETHAKGDDLSLMIDWLKPDTNWWVLDVATGGGHVTKKLAPYVYHVCTTDLTTKMLAEARKNISEKSVNVSYIEADAEKLPFLDETFDIVTCRIAAHHFPNPRMFLEESVRVLKKGGKLLLIDNIVPKDEKLDHFINKLEKLRDDSHVRCYQIEEWEGWAEDAGLQIEKSRIKKKVFDFPVWVRRTTESEEQVQMVEKHILQGEKKMQDYCGVVAMDKDIKSITIDEWMVLFKKE